VLFCCLAFAFGGFVFYAGVVVPIGTAELGSTTQGFVTRRVTRVLNVATIVAAGMSAIETWVGRRRRAPGTNRTLAALIATITLSCLTLVWLHGVLNSYLDPEAHSVAGGNAFYQRHRLYLWISTLQWLCSLPVVWILLNDSPAARKQARKCRG